MATTHTEYVIFLAFPRQQWLRERPSTLCLPVLLHVTVESLHNLYIKCRFHLYCILNILAGLRNATPDGDHWMVEICWGLITDLCTSAVSILITV
jgi:hypothetical protein